MAYDEALAQRIRLLLVDLPGFAEKGMFGGVGFMLRGNMACSVNGHDLIVRVGPHRYEQALAQPGARPFDMTGRPMTGWVVVSRNGHGSLEQLQAWVQQGVDFRSRCPPSGTALSLGR